MALAGLDHDYETGTDHAQFRQYSPAQGRWLSPDPYSGSYDPTNPQSMNRYSYVLNNPLSMTDPSGLCPPPAHNGQQQPCGGDADAYNDSIDGGLATLDEITWLQESTPWYSVQGGELMFLAADPMWYVANPNYNGADPDNQLAGTVTQVPIWIDLGAVSAGVASGGCSFFGPTPGGSSGGYSPGGPSSPNDITEDTARTPPSCLGLGIQTVRSDLSPFEPSAFSVFDIAGASLGLASMSKYNQALAYSMNRGLTYPNESSIYRDLMGASETFAEVANALPLAALDSALIHGIYEEIAVKCSYP